MVLLSALPAIEFRQDDYLPFTNRPAATPTLFGGLEVRESSDIDSIVSLALEPDHESPPLPRRAFLLCLSGLYPNLEADMNTFIPFGADDEIVAIGRGLLNRSLPKIHWTHAAHFAATLWLLARHPELDLPRELPGIIRAYNEATGVANTDNSGYHETITLASIRAARAFLAASPSPSLFLTCNALMNSPLGKRDWLLHYWSHPRLFSPEARRTWIDPDIQALPF
jgi:hypothetical protein